MSKRQPVMGLDIVPELCTGCKLCEWACSFSRYNVNSPIRSRITVTRYEEGTLDIPVVCLQCYDAPCAAVCPTGALSVDREAGIVRYDPDRCLGCRSCIPSCPFGAISWDPVSGEILKCDLCDGEPKCVEACPTGAIRFVRLDAASLERRRRAASRFYQTLQIS